MTFKTIFILSVCHLFIAADVTPPIFVEQDSSDTGVCTDTNSKCAQWAAEGECQANAAWMIINCKRSCQSCQGGDGAWKLRNELAARSGNGTFGGIKRYRINKVKLDSLSVKHLEIDEKKQNVRLHGKMVLTWNDTLLTWDKTQWKISWLNFYWVQIWTPSIIQANAINQGISSSGFHTNLLSANYTGQVFMWLDFAFDTLCDFDYTKYPFDKQKCCYKIDEERYYMVKIIASDALTDAATSSAKETHPAGWTISKVEVSQINYKANIMEDWGKDPLNVETSNVEICVNFNRDTSYVNAEIIGPVLAPAMVTLISFLFGDFRRQIHLIVASLGLQILASVPIHLQMPPPSEETPAVLKFCSFNMAMTCILLFLSAFLLALATHETPIPPPRFCTKLFCIFEKCSFCFHGDISDDKVDDGTNIVATSHSKSKYLWAPIASALKCLIFIIYICLYVIVIIGCFA